MEDTGIWASCLKSLQGKLDQDQFSMWIRPLQVEQQDEKLVIWAHNRIIHDRVQANFLSEIKETIQKLCDGVGVPDIKLELGSKQESPPPVMDSKIDGARSTAPAQPTKRPMIVASNKLNTNFTFENFVEGKSNQLARAASMQVAGNPGGSYNPFCIYGISGVGKTHLAQAVGNSILQENPEAKVLYLSSERFVSDMVKALQNNAMNEFKQAYRFVDVLVIDDIQFFAGKERSQEEFFHTFNTLLEGQKQIIITCDRYPKEINGLEDRLKSRFGWGLTVAIEPPELETRVAILINKAQQLNFNLPEEAAFFIAKCIRSNVRELEGALKRVIVNAQFTGQPCTVDFVRDSLKDLLMAQDKLITIENIQRVVANYYKVKVADLSSKRRTRSIARPRQVAMMLAKQLTSHSYPEIGDRFGGRDHTTVLHACRKVEELKETNTEIAQDFQNLLRLLES